MYAGFVAHFDLIALHLGAAAVGFVARFGLNHRIALHLVVAAVEIVVGSAVCSGRTNHQSSVVGFDCSVQIVLPQSAYLTRIKTLQCMQKGGKECLARVFDMGIDAGGSWSKISMCASCSFADSESAFEEGRSE